MFTQRKPVKTGKKDHWLFYTPLPSEKFSGWIAGKLVHTHVHWDGSSKPCLSIMTDSQLPCKYCKAEFVARYLGYLPIYHSNGDKLAVPIRQNQAELVEALTLHRRVDVLRGKSEKSPVIVRYRENDEGLYAASGERRKPADLQPWLLTLWNVPEFTAWCEAQPPPESKPTIGQFVDEVFASEQPLDKPDEETLSQLRDYVGRMKSEDTAGQGDPQLNGRH